MKDAERDAYRQTLVAALVQLSAYTLDQLSLGTVQPSLWATSLRVITDIGNLVPDDRVQLVKQLCDGYGRAVDDLEQMAAVFDSPMSFSQEEVIAQAEPFRNRAWDGLVATHKLIERLSEAEGKKLATAQR